MMGSDQEVFYKARDRRTRQFEGNSALFERPIKIFIGDDVSGSENCQIFALALLNMLSRVHRRIVVVTSSCLLATKPFGADVDLSIALINLAKSIDPFIEISVVKMAVPNLEENEITAGIGFQVPKDLNCYFGWEGGRAEVSASALSAGLTNLDLIGAATAACLAAATLFRLTHDSFKVVPRRLNLVERTEGDAAGTSSVVGHVDVGTVHLVGAGAVAHGLLYWLRAIGVVGNWEIADGDLAEIHNTNRCMGMDVSDAGWPGGIQSHKAGANKAVVAARLIGATAHPHWYDESPLVDAARPDLILPLANGRNVRASVASRGFPLIVHATTSTNWTAELHRHIADRDDCLACRFPGTTPKFECSTGPAHPGLETIFSDDPDQNATSDDAALPFLSATAGLMLAIALLELSPDQPFVIDRDNHWVLHLMLGHKLVQPSIRPGSDCKHLPSSDFRRSIHSSNPTRYDYLDTGTR
jgi:hypothetical protein